MKYSFLLALLLSSTAHAQCFSPAPPGADCDFKPPTPTISSPTLLCLPEGCNPVSYSEQVVYLKDRAFVFTNAYSFLPNGWPVKGWGGPCDQDTVCSDVRNQAYSDLELNAKRANRAQRFEE